MAERIKQKSDPGDLKDNIPTTQDLQRKFFDALKSPEVIDLMRKYEASKSCGLKDLVR